MNFLSTCLPKALLCACFVGLLGAATAVSVPTQTPVTVRLVNEISSAHAQSGDPVALTVAENVVVGGYVVIAKGAEALGMVDTVSPAGDGNPGSIVLTFKWVRAVDGSKIGVAGQQTGSGRTTASGSDITTTLSDTSSAAYSAGANEVGSVLGRAHSVLSNLGLGGHTAKAGDVALGTQRTISLAVRNPRGVTIVSSQQAETTDTDVK